MKSFFSFDTAKYFISFKLNTFICPSHVFEKKGQYLLTSWTATRITDRTILDPDLSKNIFSDSV